MLGFGAWAIGILMDVHSAYANIQIIVPSVQDLAGCESADDVTNIPAPDENGDVRFEGLAIFIPGPIFQNSIIESNSKTPFEIQTYSDPLSSSESFNQNYSDPLSSSESFDQKHVGAAAVNHANDLYAWLYGMKAGLVPETR